MNRKLKIVVATATLVAFFGGTAGFYLITGDTSLDHQIESFGYEPLKTPSRLWRIGSFYHVQANGRLSPVCHAEPGAHDALVSTSDTRTIQASSHFDSNVSVGAGLFKQLSVLLGAGALKEVTVTLTAVSVHETDYASLREIADDMMKDQNCKDEATTLVGQGELVCQVASVLQASADYEVVYNNAISANTETKEDDVGQIAQSLAANFTGESGNNGWRFESGKSLFYGVFLSPRCLALPDDTAPRWRDQSWTARLGRFVSDLA